MPELISGLVTFIAAYHYIRLFNAWVEHEHTTGSPTLLVCHSMMPTVTGLGPHCAIAVD